jgi:hypothetical protein
MTETIPESVIERLEREWRLIDRDRPVGSKPIKEEKAQQPRLKIGRVDA